MVAKRNHSMKAEGKGRIVKDKCILNDVTYVPELPKNLLSFFEQKILNVLKNNKTITKGIKQENDLYVVNFQTKIKESMLTETIENVELKLRRKEHLRVTNIKKLIDISQDININ